MRRGVSVNQALNDADLAGAGVGHAAVGGGSGSRASSPMDIGGNGGGMIRSTSGVSGLSGASAASGGAESGGGGFGQSFLSAQLRSESYQEGLSLLDGGSHGTGFGTDGGAIGGKFSRKGRALVGVTSSGAYAENTDKR